MCVPRDSDFDCCPECLPVNVQLGEDPWRAFGIRVEEGQQNVTETDSRVLPPVGETDGVLQDSSGAEGESFVLIHRTVQSAKRGVYSLWFDP